MKAVLISIHPKYCKLIADGKKTIEVRKTKPKWKTPFKCYIYATKPKNNFDKGLFRLKSDIVGIVHKTNYKTAKRMGYELLSGKIIGEFVCDMVYRFARFLPCEDKDFCIYDIQPSVLDKTCLEIGEIDNYLRKSDGYGWNISQLKIYDKPKELGEFKAWRDCETPHKEFMNCKFTYRHPSHCECCQWIKRPPQSWCYVEELE